MIVDADTLLAGFRLRVRSVVADPSTRSVLDVARLVDSTPSAVRAALESYDLLPAAKRLFRLRRRREQRAAALAKLLAFVNATGHLPAEADLRAASRPGALPLPPSATLCNLFGSVAAAYEAAGLPAPRRGGHRPRRPARGPSDG